jgi:tetratricopeptide (TPR) repeat protein
MSDTPAGLLRQGIAAARAGDKETARNLLMRVVEQDENNAAAWLWLSGVVESLDDRQVCLENVLALDPQNQAARQGLEWVRGQKAASVYVPPLISESRSRGQPLSPAAAMLRGALAEPKSPPAAPAIVSPWLSVMPQAAPESPQALAKANAALVEFDDEYLCPYCAAPTKHKDKQCAACKGKLWRSSRRKTEGSYWFWMLMGGLILSLAGRVYLFAFQSWLALGPLAARLETPEQLLWLYLGRPTLPPDVAEAITSRVTATDFWSFVISVTVQMGLIALLYLRWRPLYWIGVAVAAINLVYSLVQTLTDASRLTLLSLLISSVLILVLLSIEEDFIVEYERILCAPDKSIRTHSAFYARGREYARKRMWTLAAIHFRRAAGHAPGNVAYHLALVAAYLQLNRLERAEYVLSEAKRIEPGNPKVKELAELIAARQASYTTA